MENTTKDESKGSVEEMGNQTSKSKLGEQIKNVGSANDEVIKEVEEQSKTELMMTKLNTYKAAISAFFLSLVIIIIIIILTFSGEKHIKIYSEYGPPVIAQTGCGKVEGLVEDSAFSFRGIPYARPPINELRFKYAQPLDNLKYCWNNTFVAHNSSDVCIQLLSNGTIIGKEDCLTLDIITPYVRYDNPLPVIVLIGADSLMGGSPGKLRPSARYARSRDVVFVRPNFRMGALGFLGLEILSESDRSRTSGNYGLSDIVLSLKWVQLNIEHFGGNKDSVTILGHKAGATLVTALTAMHGASKYFKKAWACSGGAIYPKKDIKKFQKDNYSYLESVQCKDVDCLRNLDAVKLITAVEDTWRKPQPDLPLADEVPENRHEWLALDGHILRRYPHEVWSSDSELPVSLVIGTTAHSGSSKKLLMKHKTWTKDMIKEHITESFLSKTTFLEDVLKMYPLTYEGLSRMISDIRIVCPLFALSSQMKSVPFYVVTQTRLELNIADIDSDIDAILGRYEPRTPEQRRYFSAIQGLFYQYVWNGVIDENLIGEKVLIVQQDVLTNKTYSYCNYWMSKHIVPNYAALD
ncbi:neurotactin [Diorhabda carinulata]|uniref:neurotactin n=1 Tax=Diorhabda carinulata TaxID=1163345 RepID=UPI00259FE93F|nr:neurotactin [Diorhabda carinulata]XP_057660352.1 neurotactin [Diorhabda carinulata]XP_057660353.1 neurotactin [Diorhabda carinulata]